MNPDTLDDWAVCEILVNAAIEELEMGRDPMDEQYEPWGGLFMPKSMRTVHYYLDRDIGPKNSDA